MTRILYVTRFSVAKSKHSRTSGVSSYSKNLLEAILSRKPTFSQSLAVLDISDNTVIKQREMWKKIPIFRPRRANIVFKLWRACRVKKEFKPDVLHIQHEFNLFGGPLSTLLLVPLKLVFLRVPFVTTVHGVTDPKYITNDFLAQNYVSGLVPRRAVFIVFWILNQVIRLTSQKIIVHEQRFKEVLHESYDIPLNKINVVHHGIEELHSINKKTARQSLKLPTDRPTLLFMGFYTGYKGLDVLVESLEKVRSPITVVVGAGMHPRMQDSKRYVREYNNIRSQALGVENGDVRVFWPGFVYEKDLQRYYSAADIFIVPYKQAIASSGPASLAIAYGVPIIASTEFTGVFDSSALFAPNPNACARKIDQFIQDGHKLRKDYKAFRTSRLWKNVSKQTVELYEAALR